MTQPNLSPEPSMTPPPGIIHPDADSSEPQLAYLCTVSLETAPPQAIGENPHGNRQIVPVTGGRFAGPRLTGKVLPGGDWVLHRPDGVSELDGRVTWQTDDGAVLYVTYQGYRAKISPALPHRMAGEPIPAEEYYHMITLHFETGAAQYAWLEQVIVIGRGSLMPGGVSYHVYAVR